MVIDFRIRPPVRGFLDTLMYSAGERRDGFTRTVGFEPSPAAQKQSMDLLLAEMDEAGHPLGRAHAQELQGVVVEGVPVGDPVGAEAHRLGRDQQGHADRACRQLLLPQRDLGRLRARDHRHGQGRPLDLGQGRHGLVRLVYAERHEDIRDAILREKAMKRWKRQWKLRLIRQHNPDRRDLYEELNA